ncbi:dehydrogenase/reductase SDR family member 13 isoform X1 [Chelonia mydas]|uniref:dehydrogenase/reductase SDR family member 13 isoform X1 n=1 Tax=Chelonia mydas TaxID=8469 RepID=UPI000FFC2983|nr:dehydrogenase/reductase SDR family member 13 isoform X1 [Chelonia mydas]
MLARGLCTFMGTVGPISIYRELTKMTASPRLDSLIAPGMPEFPVYLPNCQIKHPVRPFSILLGCLNVGWLAAWCQTVTTAEPAKKTCTQALGLGALKGKQLPLLVPVCSLPRASRWKRDITFRVAVTGLEPNAPCTTVACNECLPLFLQESGNNEVLFMSLDLASLDSVRAFAETFLRSEPRLDILINNAGVGAGGRKKDGFNLVFQVNHLGHFLLTHLLLERLKLSAPSRVVIVASNAHRSGKIDFETLQKPVEGILQNFQAYCTSKLANILYARELANKLEGTDVTCYAVHPGVVNTELFRYIPIWLWPFFVPISWLFFRDPTDGAQTSIYCATQEGIEMFSGRYFVDCRVQDPRPQARDDAVAKKLWEVSERMVGLAA